MVRGTEGFLRSTFIVRTSRAALGLLPWALACESGAPPSPGPQRAAAPAERDPAPPAPEPQGAEPVGKGVKFPDTIAWRAWDEGLRIARAENKRIMVVVYADWCSKCRALTPVFASSEVAALAKGLVVVRQDHDENPAWLQPYNQRFGGYVPRIFFFDAQGRLDEEITSGHPRYPYFYAAEEPAFLMKSMRRALGS
jgi:thiol-disulfide isomerase/thioredoxin